MNVPVCVNVEQFVMPIERIFHFHVQPGIPLPTADLAARVAQRDIEVIDPNQFASYSRRRDRHTLGLRTSRKQKALLQIHRIAKLPPDTGEIASDRMTPRANAIEICPSRTRIACQNIQRLHRIAIHRRSFDLLLQEVGEIGYLRLAQTRVVSRSASRDALQRRAKFAPQTIAHHQRRAHQIRTGIRPLGLCAVAISAALRVNSPSALRPGRIHLLSRQRTGLSEKEPAC